MKKIFCLIFIFLFCFTITACENGNELKTVSFSDVTSAGSENYAFRIDFAKDDRVDDKYYDIQIKADGNKKIQIGKEYEDKKEVSLSSDWKSLTTLMLEIPNTETFTIGREAVSIVYIFTTSERVVITLRAVVGGIEDNAFGTGKIITSPEVCSNEFVMKI